MASPRKWFINGAKIILSATVIVAIAFAFVVLGPRGEVEEAEADLTWLGGSALKKSKQDRFITVLQKEGFSRPQPYDWNGNTIYFSHGESSGSPYDVARELQDAFVREGLNDQYYPFPPSATTLDLDSTDENLEEVAYATMATLDYFKGAMIPTKQTADHIAFNGVDVATDKEDLSSEELLEMFLTYPESEDMSGFIKNFRYIEIFRPQGSSRTEKIAIFGDGDFKLANHQPGGGPPGAGRGFEEELIPACPGCQRNSRISGLESQENFSIHTFNSTDNVENVLTFYRRVLLRRGWEPVEYIADLHRVQAEATMEGREEMTGTIEAYSKDNRMVFVHAYAEGPRETHVNIFTQ